MTDTPETDDRLLAADLHIQATYRLTEALVESENRMRRRIELLSEVVFETDAKGVLVFLNQAWSRMLGLPVNDCIGHALAEFVVEEDRVMLDQVLSSPAVVGPDRRPRLRWHRNDGGVAWAEISVTLLDGGGVVGALHDVTAVKQAEDELKRLSLVASNTDNLVVITDHQGRTEWVNEAFVRRTGYSLEEMAGKKPGEILQGPDSDPNVNAEIRAALKEGRSCEAEIVNYTRAGEPYWVDLYITPLRNERGDVERFVAIQVDTTERRRTQNALEVATEQAKQMAQSAESANKAKSEFLATMSHEIRTPMHGVLGMTELLLQSGLDAHQRSLADDIAASGEALLTIINDILDLSKIEAGRMVLTEEEFELRPLVESVVSLLANSGHGKPVVIRADFEEQVPARLKGDPGRLRQVLLNLVGNGLKFTEAGSVTTRVRLVEQTGDQTGLRFEIVDTGVGIAPENQSLLFKVFQQLDSSAARRHGGTGLGLAISRRIIELMQGRIGVESAEGQGSTFWFEICLPKGATARDTNRPQSLDGMRVLVAHDVDLLRRFLTLSLEKLGCRTHTASSGCEVLERLAQDDYDAVMFDSGLKDMEGLDLAVAMREQENSQNKKVRPRKIMIQSGRNCETPGQLVVAGIDDTVAMSASQVQLRRALVGSKN